MRNTLKKKPRATGVFHLKKGNLSVIQAGRVFTKNFDVNVLIRVAY